MLLNRRDFFAASTIVALSGCGKSRPDGVLQQAGSGHLGLNFGGISYYSTELVFRNLFLQAQPWTSQRMGMPYGEGGPLERDAEGNIVRLAPGQYAESILLLGLAQRMPAGKYRFRFQGEGRVEFDFMYMQTKRSKNEWDLEIPRTAGQLTCRIYEIPNPNNPPRQFELYLPGQTELRQTFQPDFLRRCQGFHVLRFLGLMQSNHSPIVNWRDRTLPTGTQADEKKGVAYEYLLELCSITKIAPWFCIPHPVTDDFVKHFAELVREMLPAEIPVYIEYSNEVWNGGFTQAKYCQDQGRALGLSSDRGKAGMRYYAQRSQQIFQQFEAVLGDNRVKKVVGAQFANPMTAELVLDYLEGKQKVDGLAIAPYFGGDWGHPNRAKEVREWTVDQLLAACATDIQKNHVQLQRYVELARKHSLELMAYEGGQHLVGFNGAEADERLATLFHAANRHPKMKELYLQDLRQWQTLGGGLFCTFLAMGGFSKWGAWGMLEYPEQDVQSAPKWQAIQEWLQQAH